MLHPSISELRRAILEYEAASRLPRRPRSTKCTLACALVGYALSIGAIAAVAVTLGYLNLDLSDSLPTSLLAGSLYRCECTGWPTAYCEMETTEVGKLEPTTGAIVLESRTVESNTTADGVVLNVLVAIVLISCTTFVCERVRRGFLRTGQVSLRTLILLFTTAAILCRLGQNLAVLYVALMRYVGSAAEPIIRAGNLLPKSLPRRSFALPWYQGSVPVWCLVAPLVFSLACAIFTLNFATWQTLAALLAKVRQRAIVRHQPGSPFA